MQIKTMKKKMGPLNKIQKGFERNAGENYVRKHIY